MKSVHIQTVIAEAAAKALGVTSVSPEVSYPDPVHGDVTSNIGFKLAGQLKKSPAEITAAVAAAIEHPDIEKAEAAGGYVNIWLSQGFWIARLHAICKGFADSQKGAGKNVLVEYISANPTGPLTLGNGRGGYGGDVLANVLVRAGYKVSREYYLNDAGNQIETLRSSIYAIVAEKLLGQKPDLEDAYKGEYVAEWADKVIEYIKTNHPDAAALKPEEFQQLSNKAVHELKVLDHIIQQIKDAAARMGIHFDAWFSERKELHETGKVGAVVQQLIDEDKAAERDGAIWMTGEGDAADRVLRKADGTFTYLAADLAYHRNKLAERGFDRAINLWGADHAGQVGSVKRGLELLGVKGDLDIILFQLVRLIKGGEEFKVSKRAGTYVTMDELLDEVPSDVLRFFFLMRSFNTPMDLDLDLAKEQSQKNPLFYIMYSYARAHSILEQGHSRGLTPIDTITNLDPAEIAVVRQMCRFPELLAEIADSHEVHRLTFYGIEVARLFHDLYESSKIIDLDKAEACRKLYLISRYVTFMEEYLGVLGITPVRRMER